jgi:hypothetical protein
MTKYIKSLIVPASVLAVAMLVPPAWPADECSDADPGCGAARGGCCAHCGRADDCCKVCRLETKEKELKVNCWASECKPFCLPCKSCRGCKNVECVDCSRDGSCSTKKFVWFDWCPGDAVVHHKKVLLKKEVKKKVPSYEWVVEDLCASCSAKCGSSAVPAGTKVPPVPKEAQAGNVKLMPVTVMDADEELTNGSDFSARQSLSDLISH